MVFIGNFGDVGEGECECFWVLLGLDMFNLLLDEELFGNCLLVFFDVVLFLDEVFVEEGM